MRTITFFVVLFLAAAAFCGGYAYSESRSATLIAELQRSCNLSVAETALRALDVAKERGVSQAEEGTVRVAKSLATDSTYTLIASGWSVPDFGANGAVAALREHNDVRFASLQERFGKQR